VKKLIPNKVKFGVSLAVATSFATAFIVADLFYKILPDGSYQLKTSREIYFFYLSSIWLLISIFTTLIFTDKSHGFVRNIPLFLLSLMAIINAGLLTCMINIPLYDAIKHFYWYNKYNWNDFYMLVEVALLLFTFFIDIFASFIGSIKATWNDFKIRTYTNRSIFRIYFYACLRNVGVF